MSKCRAVLSTAFADVRRGLDGRMATGGQCGPASVGLRARQAAQTERSGVQRLNRLVLNVYFLLNLAMECFIKNTLKEML